MEKRLKILTNLVLGGYLVNREEAMWLYEVPLEILRKEANQIREYYCGNCFDLCTIINGKSGRCSENCRFCAQSSHYHTASKTYTLLSHETIVEDAKKNAHQGVLRYSIVTAGRTLPDDEIDQMCETIKKIKKECKLSICASFGLLNQAQYQKLKLAGVERIHNNLETSERFFPSVCTTHSFQDKVKAIQAAQAVGLSVCSGGIMGLGEGLEDRIDMALSLRDLEIESVPVNMLNPIPGTPMENQPRLTSEELCKIVAIYRFILPKAFIRLAGGRGLLEDKGRLCFLSGANATISGDMLTTSGITVQMDKQMLKDLNYQLIALK